MKKVVFTHLSAKNFCGLKDFDADFSEKCVVKGKNREGKSTIKNAILWVFTGNLENGRDAGMIIRPQDSDGNPIDFIDISVSVTADIDGDEYVFTKTQKQKWLKKRGSDEKRFEGNENIYEISGIPKTQKDFFEMVSELICPVESLPFCINANEFLGLDNKKRREKALSLVDDFSDEKVIESNPEFEMLRADLKVGTTDEIAKRTKGTIKRLKDEQKLYPARIDELSKSIIQEDFAELELHKNALKEKLVECEAKASEEIALQTTISKEKGELAALVGKLTGSVKDKKHELELKMSDVKNEYQAIAAKITAYESELEYLEQTIENRNKVMAETERNLSLAQSREIEQISLFCPTCGQLMPTEKQDENRAKLLEQKRAEMDRYSDYLDTLKSELKTATEKAKAIREQLPEMRENKEQINIQVSELQKEISALSEETVNYEDDPEYVAKQKEIESLESQLPTFRDYKTDKYVVKEQLEEIEYRLGQAAANEKAEERIEQLKAEQLICAQNILKQEQILDTIEKFIRVKIGMIEDSANKYFAMIRFKFYQPLVNGGFSECCKITVQGIDYELSLNKSDRLLCQMDLCKGFMKNLGTVLPLILDDSESIDSDRIPDYEGQMIVLRRDDCALTVEKG